MDWVALRKEAAGYLKKYSYVLLILGIGIVLMVLPGSNGEDIDSQIVPLETQQQHSIQDSLEEILAQIHGAGKVKVLLTVAEGEITLYEKDDNIAESVDSSSRITETVIITGSDKSQYALVQQVNPPVYLGAVVVCQGADSAAVRLAVTEAVAAATGLSVDKITVLKMK